MAVAAAVSAFLDFVWRAASWLVEKALRPLIEGVGGLVRPLLGRVSTFLNLSKAPVPMIVGPDDTYAKILFLVMGSYLFLGLRGTFSVLFAIEVLITILALWIIGAKAIMADFVEAVVWGIVGVSMGVAIAFAAANSLDANHPPPGDGIAGAIQRLTATQLFGISWFLAGVIGSTLAAIALDQSDALFNIATLSLISVLLMFLSAAFVQEPGPRLLIDLLALAVSGVNFAHPVMKYAFSEFVGQLSFVKSISPRIKLMAFPINLLKMASRDYSPPACCFVQPT